MTPSPEPVSANALAQPQPQPTTALAGRAMTPGQLATVLIEKENFDVEKLARLMELQAQHEREQARQAYAQAIVAFRAKCPTIRRTGTANYGPGKTSYTYAQLPEAVEQIQKLMDDCQLAVTWVTPQQSEKWIQVTCTVTHVLGHSESTTLGGPPDGSGSKNQLQAIKSTWTYLRRVTLFSLLGLVDKDEPDDDGAGGKEREPAAPPVSQQALTDPENEAKREFWNACQQKAGSAFTREQVVRIFGRVQEASGQQSAAECLAWLGRDEVLIATDGTLSIVTEPADDPFGASQTPAAAEPDGLAQEASAAATSPPPPSYQCDTCLMTYPVKTANDKCLTKGCKGTVKPRA